jgi:putative hydrolase
MATWLCGEVLERVERMIPGAPPAIRLAEDHHVHSTFSDGADTLECNLAAARAAGLTRLGCVDHVRSDSQYVAAYVAAVRALGGDGMVLTAGIESKMLDAEGTLDLPADYRLADVVYVADHQFPAEGGPQSPRMIRELLLSGGLGAHQVIGTLVDATERALRRYRDTRLVLAHLFSILPKMGLAELDVPVSAVSRLARAAADAGAVLEVSERWRCPSTTTVRVFRQHAVPIVASTDSHKASTIGRYEYVRTITEQIDAPA